MPRPKRPTVVTQAPAHTRAAVKEVKIGITQVLWLANRAPMLDASDPARPLADSLTQLLAAIKEGRQFAWEPFWPWWAAQGCVHLFSFMCKGWHLQRCGECARWLLAKDQRVQWCRRPACRRAVKARQKATQRTARRELDRGQQTSTRRTF
jgi:hypothetical protein